VAPSGGRLDVRFYTGEDENGTELLRVVACERSEQRVFSEGLKLPGPVYLYFYEGDGAVVILT
jgi:hypothetical protein